MSFRVLFYLNKVCDTEVINDPICDRSKTRLGLKCVIGYEHRLDLNEPLYSRVLSSVSNRVGNDQLVTNERFALEALLFS